MNILRFLKKCVMPHEIRPRTIPIGLYQGIRMEIDLQNQSQLFYGLWEAETHSWMRKLSSGIKTAIDIGAGCGEQTLYFLLKTGANKVYAIEPDSAKLDALLRNVKLNRPIGSKKFDFISKFVGKADDDHHFSLDSLYEQVEFPCFIKMDIEGGELDALMGAKKFLKQPATSWLVETHSYRLERECQKIFLSQGLLTKILYNAWWRFFLPEQRPLEMNRWMIAYRSASPA